jgi:uncharacterized integral membrane protein
LPNIGYSGGMENSQLFALVFAVVAVTDVAMIPFLNKRIQGPQKMIVSLALLSGAMITAGLSAAFWFEWISI